MAAIDTFEWLTRQLWPHPHNDAVKFISEQRHALLKIRNENERLRFIEELKQQARELKKRKMVP